VSEDTFDELAFVRRRAFDADGERKTVIICSLPEAQKIATKGQPPFMRPALVTATSSPAQNGRRSS
jgi:hypothetical protein